MFSQQPLIRDLRSAIDYVTLQHTRNTKLFQIILIYQFKNKKIWEMVDSKVYNTYSMEAPGNVFLRVHYMYLRINEFH